MSPPEAASSGVPPLAPPPSATAPRAVPPSERASVRAATIRLCPSCGYRGEGVRYFERGGHVLLLIGISVFTYGVGGLIYWAVKRHRLVCPSCGTALRVDAPFGLPAGPREAVASAARVVASVGAGAASGRSARKEAREARRAARRGEPDGLPGGGGFRRFLGVAAGLGAAILLGLGLLETEPVLALIGSVVGTGGGALFAWGWSARRQRGEAVRRALERATIRLAQASGGRLTATEVASELDVSLAAAERILFSLDDGFRVRSEVTNEGLLVFDFSEIRSPDESGSARLDHGAEDDDRA